MNTDQKRIPTDITAEISSTISEEITLCIPSMALSAKLVISGFVIKQTNNNKSKHYSTIRILLFLLLFFILLAFIVFQEIFNLIFSDFLCLLIQCLNQIGFSTKETCSHQI